MKKYYYLIKETNKFQCTETYESLRITNIYEKEHVKYIEGQINKKNK